jgi:nucleotide-binding universal stress UspA family protein
LAGVFDRILVGVEETPASMEAVRQARRLRPPEGLLHLVCVVHLAPAVSAGWSAPRLMEELEREAGEALRAAQSLAPEATAALVEGSPVVALLRQIDQLGATLVAVGTHGTSRPEGILLGGVTTTLVHEAPCSVLVARPAGNGERFPRAMAVGVDGSPPSVAAAEAAAELADRLGVPLRRIASLGGKRIDPEAIRQIFPDVEVDKGRDPVRALVAASREVDLLVVGSRGLHGLRALGSVSERVAHQAGCSVLVVRGDGKRRDRA